MEKVLISLDHHGALSKLLQITGKCLYAGKTSFLQRHVYGKNHKIYEPHTGVVVYPVCISTDLGRFSFNCWDTPEQDMFLQDVHYNGSHCAIIMFDVTSRLIYKNIPKWCRALRRV